MGTMKNFQKLLFTIGLFFFATSLFAQSQGETFFKQKCSACHTINKGRLVGPDLVNIHQKRNEEWLIKYIQSSQTMIQSGDSIAVAIFEEYNRLIMPDPQLSASEIKLVLDYIESSSGAVADIQISENSILKDITAAEINNGRNLFEGIKRFENGGPACISCHSVQSSLIFPGGKLSKDLTKIFESMNDAGIKAIISNPPFPVMMQAYNNSEVTEQETKELLAFLFYSNKNLQYQSHLNFDNTLLLAVLFGIILLGSIYSVMWLKVKKQNANYSVFR